MIKRCTGKEKHSNKRSGYDGHRKLELNPPEKNRERRMMILKLWSIFMRNSPDWNIEGKGLKRFLMNKMDT
jgi:hypothetical protein